MCGPRLNTPSHCHCQVNNKLNRLDREWYNQPACSAAWVVTPLLHQPRRPPSHLCWIAGPTSYRANQLSLPAIQQIWRALGDCCGAATWDRHSVSLSKPSRLTAGMRETLPPPLALKPCQLTVRTGQAASVFKKNKNRKKWGARATEPAAHTISWPRLSWLARQLPFLKKVKKEREGRQSCRVSRLTLGQLMYQLCGAFPALQAA